MGQVLFVLLIIGVGLWVMRRGGCCGMGRPKDKGFSQEEKEG